MLRRKLLAATAALAVATMAKGQAPRPLARVGVLAFGEPEPFVSAFAQALRDLGYVDGRDVLIEHRSAGRETDRLAPLAAELVNAGVDVLVARTTPAVQAAMSATRTIPIVMSVAGDALRTGLVSSLARPGGNVTGLSLALVELAGKTVEVLREAVPRIATLACIVHGDDPLHEPFLVEAGDTARRAGLAFRTHVVRSIGEVERAFAGGSWGTSVGVLLQPIFAVDRTQRTSVVALTRARRSPAVCGLRSFAEAGGLMAYSSEFEDQAARTARYVDRILRGASPASLPVEQPREFELAINLRTATSLGIAIPTSLMVRARVIE